MAMFCRKPGSSAGSAHADHLGCGGVCVTAGITLRKRHHDFRRAATDGAKDDDDCRPDIALGDLADNLSVDRACDPPNETVAPLRKRDRDESPYARGHLRMASGR